MTAKPARVLIADDQDDVLQALKLLLKRDGIEVLAVRSPAAVVVALEGQDFDAALIDLNYTRDTTSGKEGLDLLGELRRLEPTLPIVVMTAWGSIEGAVDAMRRGARDYVQKPWDNAALLSAVRAQVDLGRALRRTRLLENENRRLRGNLPRPIAETHAMREVLRLIERVAPSDANILITGEHGTGKEVLTRWIHASSARADRPLVTMDAGGVAEGVFESELFGHVRGAFTDAKTDRVGCFELADGGTLFLDEVGNMPLSQQAKLLRVLQTGELHPVGSSKVRKVNVRVVAATNAELPKEVAAGRFREDLLYRLNTVEIAIPSLRQRREDIPPLASEFLSVKATRYGRAFRGFEAAALTSLLEYQWPGNVRELEHAIERAVLLAQGEWITAQDLNLRPRPSTGAQSRLEDLSLEQAERYLIERALAKSGGNVSGAAQTLGLSRSALYRRLHCYGIKGRG